MKSMANPWWGTLVICGLVWAGSSSGWAQPPATDRGQSSDKGQAPAQSAEGDNPLAWLVGTWTADLERTQQVVSAEEAAALEANLEDVRGLVVTYRDNGTFRLDVGRAGERTFNGLWSGQQTSEEPIAFTVTMSPPEDEPEGANLVVTIARLDENTITMQPTEKPRVVLVRRPAETAGGTGRDEVAARLAGAWVGDAELTSTLLTEAQVSPDDQAQMLETVAGIRVEFRQDETYAVTMTLGQDSMNLAGAWEILEVHDQGKSIVLRTEADEASGGEMRTFVVKFLDDDRMTMQPQGEPPAGFRRAN
jgi:hypothetical protein